MIESFKNYICSNCKGQCEKGIVIVNYNGIRQAKCTDYEKKKEVEGYKKQESRTAKQKKPLMNFVQEY